MPDFRRATTHHLIGGACLLAAVGACGSGADSGAHALLAATVTQQHVRRDPATGVAESEVRVRNQGTAPAVLAGCGRAGAPAAYVLERRQKWSWVETAPAAPVCPAQSGPDAPIAPGASLTLQVRVADVGRYRLRMRYASGTSGDASRVTQSESFVVE